MTVEFCGFFNADERQAGTAEEFFHVFGVATDVVFGLGAIIEFDGADGAEGAFVAKDEVDCLIFDKTVGFVAVLAAYFVAQEGGKADIGDDVESLAEDVIEELETVFLTASHELFAGAVMETVNRVATAALGGNHDKNRQYEKSGGGHTGDSDKNFVHKFFSADVAQSV